MRLERTLEIFKNIQNLLSFCILRPLKMSVSSVVQGVEVVQGDLITCRMLQGGGSRSQVHINRFLPETKSCKNMGWHVQCVRDIGGDFPITARYLQRVFSKRRTVVGMDNIVVSSRMIRNPS